MIGHVLRIVAIIAGIMLATLLPYFPGAYDSLAVTVSGMARAFGYAGLLLVPVGLFWMASRQSAKLAARQYGFAKASLVTASFVWLLLSMGALMNSGAIFALATAALGAWIISRLLPRVRALKGAGPQPPSAASFYMVVVPVAVLLLQRAVAEPAAEFSRNRAIENSAELISEIEKHRMANGRYPVSLLSVWRDYKPGLIGIWEYHYEPRGDSYNLVFEQPTFIFGTREFVAYNPRDDQVVTSHKYDLLQNTPEQLRLEQTRGHYAVHNARQPHWKYFWFD